MVPEIVARSVMVDPRRGFAAAEDLGDIGKGQVLEFAQEKQLKAGP